MAQYETLAVKRPASLSESVNAAERLILALDVPKISEARKIVEELDGIISFFKLGPWLQLVDGFDGLIRELIEQQRKIFLDTKGCDIPETMRAGASAAANRGISFLTIHGNGEVTDEAMRAAVKGKGDSDLKIFTVTVLTSLDQRDLDQMGYAPSVTKMALMRAEKALRCGCDGVIASGHEARAIRDLAGDRPFLIISPGIRPSGSCADDHKRSMTPNSAISSGADYLVVGRPIIHSENRVAAAQQIIDEMQAAFDQR